MGFFQELKEDLSQAVSELVPDEDLETVEVEQEEDFDTEALLEKAEADFTEELEAMAEAEEVAEPAVEAEPVVEPVFAPVKETEVVSSSPVAADELSTITSKMVVKGDIDAEGSLDLFGSVVGNITVLGKLNVTGSITGNSEAAEVYAQGANITGNVTSLGSVKIANGTVIRGNIYATSAVVAGAVKGDIDVKGPVILDASAIVMGNIKSKSVQINNGAVIEGLCSQCYAEVNPSSFFGD